MSEKEKRILETFGRIIPELSEEKKCFFLGFGGGLAFKAGQEKEQFIHNETSGIKELQETELERMLVKM